MNKPNLTFLVVILWDPISVGEENETPFIRVWKPFSNRCVLKTLRESPKGKAQRGQYLLAVDLGRYKWYQSQTPDDVAARRLFPEGGQTRGRVSIRTLGPEGGGFWWGGPHRLEKGTGVSEDAGPWRGVNCEIPRWLGRKPFPSRCVLETLRESPKGKSQIGQYQLVVGLGRYRFLII